MSTPPSLAEIPVTHIRPPRGLAALRLGDLWEYRELLFFLTWRDIKVRYKQTALGVAWAVLQPLLTMLVFTIFFGRLGGMQERIDVPYPIFAFCGLLPWQLFSYSMSQAGNSMVSSQQLIRKVFFPRLVIPISSVLAGVVDFLIAFGILMVMMAYYGIAPGIGILALPLFVLFTVATSLAVGLWLSALNVQYRDVRYTLPFLTQLWMFITPIVYPSQLLTEKWRLVYALNPMAGVVEGFRWALLGQEASTLGMVAVSSLVVLAALVGGLFYFKHMERSFADVV